MVLKEKHLEYDLESLHSPIYIYEPLEKPRHPPPCPPRPLAATTGPFTLNALVALLATLKWARFATRGGGGSKDPVAARPLSEFCSIDQASRGPVGSLAALPAVFPMPLVLVGALIMVVAVGFDFAAQQLISLEPRAVQPAGAMSEPFVPRAQFFYNDESGGQDEYIRTVFAAGKGLVTTIDKGCGGDPGVLDVAATCQTGNCTFPIFNTLAMCSKCVSIRDQPRWVALEPAPGDSGAGRNDSTVYEIKWTAPGNATLVQRVWPALGWPDYAVAPLGLTIMKFQARALAADAMAAPPIGAWRCGISPCVRTLAVSVVNGRQRTAVLAEYDNDTQLATAATATRPNISRAAKFLIKDSDENTQPAPALVLRPNMLSEFEVSYAGVVRGVATTQQVFVSVAWVWLSLPAALVACAALLLPATAVYSTRRPSRTLAGSWSRNARSRRSRRNDACENQLAGL
ncbi:hypothetical protein GGTG_04758 [Gaeumannomyces tritici R3-111a-1]|uniref:Uncharacterized protein n=1 Tax=Gaeumannomyces tritici (strain R3-111a-1) TaxID=644352 RepID=J3NU09_GAET3|nr:hypothetical protein GGTG_04758 [Gaeumannomyces tritici R3-111a-1]EJT79674.1 hypothetical protein GGTG_04758 [Gaeumannomyces tritici R3-111a-1]